jgi:glutamyl-tRNA reductase
VRAPANASTSAGTDLRDWHPLAPAAIVLIGSNHACASVDLRERLAFSGETLAEALRVLRARVDEALIVSTCNRTELYALTENPVRTRDEIYAFLAHYHRLSPGELTHASYASEDAAAVTHLFRVASGLDSMVLGEPQILTQIRDALDQARAVGAVGPMLSRLATDALHVGKRARTETSIARNRLSIAHAAVELALRELDGLGGKSAAIIGAGKMATLTAKLLRAADVGDLTIVNRSMPRAQELASTVGGTAVPLNELTDALDRADLVVGAAMAERPLVTVETIRPGPRRTRPLLLVDLAVPRIVDPEVAHISGVLLRDVDALEGVAQATRSRYAGEVAKVERLIADATDDYLQWQASRGAAQTIAAITKQAETQRDAEFERAARRLRHLSERDLNVVRALAVGLTNKLLHEPVTALRRHPAEPDVQLASRLFGVDDIKPGSAPHENRGKSE